MWWLLKSGGGGGGGSGGGVLRVNDGDGDRKGWLMEMEMVAGGRGTGMAVVAAVDSLSDCRNVSSRCRSPVHTLTLDRGSDDCGWLCLLQRGLAVKGGRVRVRGQALSLQACSRSALSLSRSVCSPPLPLHHDQCSLAVACMYAAPRANVIMLLHATLAPGARLDMRRHHDSLLLLTRAYI